MLQRLSPLSAQRLPRQGVDGGSSRGLELQVRTAATTARGGTVAAGSEESLACTGGSAWSHEATMGGVQGGIGGGEGGHGGATPAAKLRRPGGGWAVAAGTLALTLL